MLLTGQKQKDQVTASKKEDGQTESEVKPTYESKVMSDLKK
jgi:hypothetical protein